MTKGDDVTKDSCGQHVKKPRGKKQTGCMPMHR